MFFTGKDKAIEVKQIQVSLKVSDMFHGILSDPNGDVIGEYEGYVPAFFPEEHYGDYVVLDIDIDTGQITNWNPPRSNEDLKMFFNKPDDEGGE